MMGLGEGHAARWERRMSAKGEVGGMGHMLMLGEVPPADTVSWFQHCHSRCHSACQEPGSLDQPPFPVSLLFQASPCPVQPLEFYHLDRPSFKPRSLPSSLCSILQPVLSPRRDRPLHFSLPFLSAAPRVWATLRGALGLHPLSPLQPLASLHLPQVSGVRVALPILSPGGI